VRRFYEDIWSQTPEGLEPFEFERRRRFLLSRVRPGDRVLDIGCGEGVFCGLLAAAGARPVGAEIAQEPIDRARRRHPGLRFELVEPHGPLPFEDAGFDLVWASEVIEHVADTARWLSELRRVLRGGGRLLVTTPSHGRMFALGLALRGLEGHFDPTGQHLRFYTRRSLRGLLDSFGFEPVWIGMQGRFPRRRRTLLADAHRPSWSLAASAGRPSPRER
jgi:ubiquinone/menaquinone biosynthesis C-methylase UbiE